MASLRTKLMQKDGFYFLRKDMSFIKSWWLLYWYCREIFLLNERVKARKHGKVMLWMVKRSKPKDFSRAQVFSFYLLTIKSLMKTMAKYGE